MKTSELIGHALDWAVAKCEGATKEWRDNGPFFWDGVACIREFGHDIRFTPSTNWSQGGPIIEREKIVLYIYTTSGGGSSYRGWSANKHERQYDEESGEYIKGSDFFMIGDTPLIAAMRCYVASKLGNEVDIPEELL